MSTTVETERVTLGLLRSRSKTGCVVKFSPSLKESVLGLPNFVHRERYISRRPFEANEVGVVEVYRFVEDATLPARTISLQTDQEPI